MGHITEKIVGAVLIGSRWLMAPLYLGLMAALIVDIAEYFYELYVVVVGFGGFDSAKLILAVLKLIELVLLGNLLLIMLFAGVVTLDANILLDHHPNWLRFVGQVDFAGLKLKVMASLTAIAGVGLLETFVDIEKADKSNVLWEIAIMVAFVVAGVMLAWMDLLVSKRHE